MLHGILVDKVCADPCAAAARTEPPHAQRIDPGPRSPAAPGWPGLIVRAGPAASWLERLRHAWSCGAILRRTKRPILMLRNRASRPYARVLVAVDFSDAALERVRAAVRCAPGARVTLLHPLDTGTEGAMRRPAVAGRFLKRHRRRLQAQARAAFRRFVVRLGLPEVHFSLRLTGYPERVALGMQAAREGTDLVVVRKPQDGPLGRWLGFGAARALMRATRCDLLLIGAGRGARRASAVGV